MNPSPCLTVEQLNMRFGGLHALKDIDLSVDAKAITAIIGPNGAGKTTLFNCLTGFYRIQEGDVFFHDEKGRHWLNKRLGLPFKMQHLWHPKEALETFYYKMFGGSHLIARLGIARTFQTVRLFKEMSVIENCLIAQHQHLERNLIKGLINARSYREKMQEALDTAHNWLKKFELTQEANRLAGQLPYGKQRHLEIARCLCTQPKLLCLDEPAAGLNATETRQLSDNILWLKSLGLSILLIEHDMSMVMNSSDSIYVLDHGEVISSGTPEHVRHDPKVIEAYLGKTQDR